MPAFLSNGRHVFANPYDAGDGGLVADPGMAAPLEARLSINGAPIIEDTHQLILKRMRPEHAQD